MQSFISRLMWGAKWGTRFGFAYFVLACVLVALGGGRGANAEPPTLARLAAVYMIGGILSGIQVGALLPIAKSRNGAAIAGALVAVPFSVLLRFSIEGFGPWRGEDTVVSLLFAALIGIPAGVVLREIFAPGGREDR